MISIGNIDAFMSELAPSNLSESWDNDGFMVGLHPSEDVKKVLVCLEVTQQALDYAVEKGFDLIITHHPYIFKKLSQIVGVQYEYLEKMIKNGISVLSYHTRLDSAKGGVNDVLAKKLGLKDVSSFGGESGNIGRMGRLDKEMTPVEFAHYLKKTIGCDVKCTLSKERTVKFVAVVGGAGKDYIFDGFEKSADAFVTSEIPHHMFVFLKECDLSVYDCGHYYTENPVCEEIARLLKEKFEELEVEVFDIGCPYTCIL